MAFQGYTTTAPLEVTLVYTTQNKGIEWLTEQSYALHRKRPSREDDTIIDNSHRENELLEITRDEWMQNHQFFRNNVPIENDKTRERTPNFLNESERGHFLNGMTRLQ
jgi:hypothetical protein